MPNFEQKLKSGEFVITSEITPPKGIDVSPVLQDANNLKGWVDAINITDNNRAIMRMCPLALGKMLIDSGHEVIMQMTCRDRNRLSIQSDLLGANAFGIKNICLMTGDHTTKGDHPGAKPVYDLDSVQLLSLVRMIESGYDFSGNQLEGVPSFTVGAVSGIDSSRAMQMLKLKKKVDMGANFIQTQAVYDVAQFEQFIESVKHLNVPIIAGLIPLKSAKMAHFMNNNIPGIKINDDVISRMEKAKDPVHEGLVISSETINAIRNICSGIHIMPVGKNLNTVTLLEMAGFSSE
ncbi:MAG: methylenetetrahydrofolate reductase [Methanohalobium sp.]|uniref:methylenetetrahydrofolate reductase n=1 Tax=Methanohalobium sp. TaxID=2837493 RepID=UPI0039794067